MGQIKTITQRLNDAILMSSTRKLVNVLLVFEVACFGFFLGWGFLYQEYRIIFYLIMSGIFLILAMIGFFLTGAVMFFRRENPYTFTESWFGIHFFSHGVWPMGIGLLIMLLSGASIIALAIPFIRQILPF